MSSRTFRFRLYGERNMFICDFVKNFSQNFFGKEIERLEKLVP